MPVGELEFFYRKNSHHGVKWVTEVLESVNIGEDKELEDARNFMLDVSSKIDFHQSGTEKGTRERVRSKVTKFGYHYKFLSSF